MLNNSQLINTFIFNLTRLVMHLAFRCHLKMHICNSLDSYSVRIIFLVSAYLYYNSEIQYSLLSWALSTKPRLPTSSRSRQKCKRFFLINVFNPLDLCYQEYKNNYKNYIYKTKNVQSILSLLKYLTSIANYRMLCTERLEWE